MHVIWNQNQQGLCCSLVFTDFHSAMAFVQELAAAAEEMNHHPDWRNSSRRLDICLSTHDAGGQVTEKDYALCAEINRILLSYQFENT